MPLCTNIYIAEISTPQHRGSLIALIPVAYYFGTILYGVFYYCVSEKIMISFMLSLSIGSLCLTYFLPESPIWLYSKGRYQESVDVLTNLRRVDQETINSEIKEIKNFCGTQGGKLSMLGLVKECLKAWKPFALAVILLILMYNTGYSIFIIYLDLYRSSKDTFLDSYSLNFFLCSFIAPFVMYILNVKVIIGMASFGMGLCLLVLDVFGNHNIISYIVKYLYLILSRIGIDTVFYIVTAEIFPQKVNSILSSQIISFTYIPYLVNLRLINYLGHLGPYVPIWVFCIHSFILCIFVKFFFPNTSGRTLNEIQNQYFKKGE